VSDVVLSYRDTACCIYIGITTGTTRAHASVNANSAAHEELLKACHHEAAAGTSSLEELY